MLQDRIAFAVNAYAVSFNGHPPLGVNATFALMLPPRGYKVGGVFQQAPTLGGECYVRYAGHLVICENEFQQAPTLGGECYDYILSARVQLRRLVSTSTHPWG